MLYAEASYFDGYAFAHIAAYDDDRRLKAIRKAANARIARERRSAPRGNECRYATI